MKKQYLTVGVLAVLLIALAGCGNPSGGGDPPGPQSVVYKSTNGVNEYELTITESSGGARYAAKTGDSYVLKIIGAGGTKISTGTVASSAAGVLTLKPSSSAVTFTITISSGNMTAITGTIVLGNGTTEPEPGAVTSLPPATIDLSGMTNVQVYNEDGTEYTETVTFTHRVHGNASLEETELGNHGNPAPLEVVTGGKLNLSAWGTYSIASGDTENDIARYIGEGLTATPSTGVKVTHGLVGDTGFKNATDTKRLYWEGFRLVYTDTDVIITGTNTADDGYVNLNLKQGWNTVIGTADGEKMSYVSGVPGANNRWVIRDGGGW
jgi:hypothetical protein